MTFEQMLQGAEVLSLSGNADVTGLAYDSRQGKPGYVFLPRPHTPPGSLELNRFLAEGLGQGATEAVMEVSSHALAQQRVFAVPFDVAVFTNLTRDHLDYHHSMDSYFDAKRMLFEGCGTDAPRSAIINTDDEYGQKLVQISKKSGSRVSTYGWT